MSNIIIDGKNRTSYSVVRKDTQQKNGIFIPVKGIRIFSGTLGPLTGGEEAIVELNVDSFGFWLRRAEIFHSGSATLFNFTIETRENNSGANFDPRHVVVEYSNVVGSENFTSGVDQMEEIVAIIDAAGKAFLKVEPNGAANDNYFKYMLILEDSLVYVDNEGNIA